MEEKDAEYTGRLEAAMVPYAAEYKAQEHKADSVFVLEAPWQKETVAPKQAAQAHKFDRGIVLEAVLQKDTGALKHVTPEHKDGREIVLKPV